MSRPMKPEDHHAEMSQFRAALDEQGADLSEKAKLTWLSMFEADLIAAEHHSTGALRPDELSKAVRAGMISIAQAQRIANLHGSPSSVRAWIVWGSPAQQIANLQGHPPSLRVVSAPPHRAEQVGVFLLPRATGINVIGDLRELYPKYVERLGECWASVWFWKEVILAIWQLNGIFARLDRLVDSLARFRKSQ